MNKKDIKKLAEWCGYSGHCYWLTVDGQLYNTGECSMLCDSVEWAIMNAEVVEEVTDKSESYHPQLDYDVRRNNCKLYRIVSNDFEYVISYFEYGIDIDEED